MFSHFYCSSFHYQAPTDWKPLDENGDFSWSSQTAMPGERIAFFLKHPMDVSSVEIDQLWTDVSTDGFRADIFLLTQDNTWFMIQSCTTNINYPRNNASPISPKVGFAETYKNENGPLAIQLDKPVLAYALMVTFTGHGWFGMRGLPTLSGKRMESKRPTVYMPAGHTFILP